MAEVKITGLTEDTTPSGTDLVESVKDPNGTPLSRKVTHQNLRKQLRNKWIAANEFTPRLTNGAAPASRELTGDYTMVEGYDFDKDTDEAIQYVWAPPDEWDRDTVKVKHYWTNAATVGTGTVYWGCRAKAVSDDDAIDGSWGTAVLVSDAIGTENDLHVGAASGAITVAGTPTLGDLVWIEVYRDADNASDDYTQDARYVGCMIQYMESSTEPSAW